MLDFVKVALAQGIVPKCPSSGCGLPELYQLGYNIINFGLKIAAMLAVVFIIWGGIMLLTSGGSEERTSRGKQAITSAVIGIIIVLSSWLIVNTFITVFTKCTGNWAIFGGLQC